MFTIQEFIYAKQNGLRFAGRPASPNTLSSYEWCLKRLEKEAGCTLGEFTEQEANASYAAIAHLSASTRGLCLVAANAAFDWAIANHKYGGMNPFTGIDMPKRNKKLPTVLSKKQVKELIAAVESPTYRTFFSVMYYCGLRIGEVRNLKSNQLLNDQKILVEGKGGKQRIVPCPSALFEELQTLAKERPVYLFSSGDKPISLRSPLYQFDKAKKKLGLPEALRPHNLRHTSATHFQQAAKDITVTQKFLGHSSPVTTMVYAQIADEEVNKAHLTAFGD